MSEKGQPLVMVQSFCDRHRYDLIVRRLKITEEEGGWLVAEVTGQILMFRQLAADPRIAARCSQVDGKADANDLSLVLAELGCPACYEPRYYRNAYRCLKKGVEFAAKVAQGKAADLENGFEQLVPDASRGT